MAEISVITAQIIALITGIFNEVPVIMTYIGEKKSGQGKIRKLFH